MNKYLEVFSPYDLKKLKSIKYHNAQDAKNMLQNAQKAFKDKSNWLSLHERIEILNKLKILLEKKSDDFSILIAKEGGKPLTDAQIEVARAINGIELAIIELHHLSGQMVKMGTTPASQNRLAYTILEPIGIVIAVSAFNHPLNLIIHQIIPAIAIGCPVIIKPALTTPLCCIEFVKLVHKAGLKEEWCQVVILDNKNAELLVTDKSVDFFSFIGSASIGFMLKQKLSPRAKCVLEHGGAAPVIVDNDQNIDNIIPSLIKGSFYHAGQVCVSVQRIFVHKNKMTEFSDKFSKATNQIITGDPTKIETQIGPLILEKEILRIDEWVKEAVKDGAKLLTGGKKIGKTCYKPTILLNPNYKSRVSNFEIFGPVVCIYEYNDINEAVKQANNVDYAFQAAIFSNNLTNVNYAIDNLIAQAVIVNDHTAFRIDSMPFGGFKNSGFGTGGIGPTMHDMVREKLIVIKK